MKLTTIILTILALLSIAATSYGGSAVSYESTVASIKATMAKNPSLFRQERYGDIKFSGCRLSYAVSGTYPVGGTYTMEFRDMDFSTLNPEQSLVSHDYTAFLALNFSKEIGYRGRYEFKAADETLEIHTVVVNVSDDEVAQILFKDFMHLGELCAVKEKSQ